MRWARQTLVIGIAAALFITGFGGLREYRRALWRRTRDHWITHCTTEVEARVKIDARSAERVCGCTLDYISVRWSPEAYMAKRETIERSMVRDGVTDLCLAWAGGWSNARP